MSRVPLGTALAFSAPAVGAGYMYLLLALYVLKFSTDVLLIGSAVMGFIFMLSRIWDAVSDPLIGYLSDRTTTRLGRRRTWILASIAPVALMFYAVFAPPAGASGFALELWMGVMVIGFYSAMTLFFVPHLSLGAELSDNYHERSRLFGMRHAAYTVGSILALISMQLLINAQYDAEQEVRVVAREQALVAVLVMVALTIFAVVKLRERPEFQGRVATNPYHAFRDVWRNPHARLLIIVTFIEYVGSAAIGALTLYVMQYVVGRLTWAPIVILSYMVPSALSVPLWIPLSRRFGKIRLWMFSMILTGLAFGGMFALPFLATVEARLTVIIVLATLAGAAAGCGGTIAPSIQGDVIDYDELATSERKEGSYFAAWNFVHKLALGVMLGLTGFTLGVAGFVPNQEQTMTVQLAMVTLYGLFPLVCYTVGTLMFSRFKLDERAHSDIRRALDNNAKARAAASGA